MGSRTIEEEDLENSVSEIQKQQEGDSKGSRRQKSTGTRDSENRIVSKEQKSVRETLRRLKSLEEREQKTREKLERKRTKIFLFFSYSYLFVLPNIDKCKSKDGH